jgi:hypothetical protein
VRRGTWEGEGLTGGLGQCGSGGLHHHCPLGRPAATIPVLICLNIFQTDSN